MLILDYAFHASPKVQGLLVLATINANRNNIRVEKLYIRLEDSLTFRNTCDFISSIFRRSRGQPS